LVIQKAAKKKDEKQILFQKMAFHRVSPV